MNKNDDSISKVVKKSTPSKRYSKKSPHKIKESNIHYTAIVENSPSDAVKKKGNTVGMISDEDQSAIIDVSGSVTETGRIKDELQKSRKDFLDFFENHVLPGIIIEPSSGKILQVNKAAARFYGRTREEISRLTVFQIGILQPEELQAEIQKALLNKKNVFESQVRTADGSIRDVKIICSTLHLRGMDMLHCIILDASDRKQMEDILQSTEEKFALIFKHSPVAISISTLDEGRYMDVNDVYLQILGYQREEIIGRTADDFRLWVDKNEREAMIKEVSKNGKVNNFEIRFRDKRGNIRWGLTSASVIMLSGQSYLLAQTQEITEHKKKDENLKKSEERYRLFEENVADALYTMDMNFRYTYVSPSIYPLLGYTPEEFLKMGADQVVDEETYARFVKLLAEELETEKRPDRDLHRSRTLEYQHIHKDGSKMWAETRVTFLRDKNNDPVGIIGVTRDISDRKKAQESALNEFNFSRSVLDSLMIPFFMFDFESGIFFRWNKAFRFACGYTDEEIAVMKPVHLIPESERGILRKIAEEFTLKEKG
jgi:PAS domain S-box-containing protein